MTLDRAMSLSDDDRARITRAAVAELRSLITVVSHGKDVRCRDCPHPHTGTR